MAPVIFYWKTHGTELHYDKLLLLQSINQESGRAFQGVFVETIHRPLRSNLRKIPPCPQRQAAARCRRKTAAPRLRGSCALPDTPPLVFER